MMEVYEYLKLNSKTFNANFFMILLYLYLVFAVLSNISLPGNAYGETGYIEALQVILIISTVIVGFVRKGYLINVYSRSTYWLRQSLFSLLFFEEISYLTTHKFNFLDYNHQSELNLHNSKFLIESFASFAGLGDDLIHLHPFLIIKIFAIIFFLAGSRIPFFKRFNIISLHPLLCVGILFYPFNLIFSYLIRNLLPLINVSFVVTDELMELFLYIVFSMDIVIKSYPRLSANACK